jgi:6-phosphogluconolactonase
MFISVLESAAELADAAAAHLTDLISATIVERGRCSVALSGGSTPGPTLARLRHSDVDWRAVSIYQVDERVAVDGDTARNSTMIEAALTAAVDAAWYPMPVLSADVVQDYSAVLPDQLDIVQLGLGSDGHTASLLPGDPALEVRDRPVALTAAYNGHERVTLTVPAINDARHRVWLAVGDSKLEPLTRMLRRDDIPASLINSADSTFFWSL